MHQDVGVSPPACLEGPWLARATPLLRAMPNLPTTIIPDKIRWLKASGKSPMDMRISPLEIKILLQSNPLKSRILVQRLAVHSLRLGASALHRPRPHFCKPVPRCVYMLSLSLVYTYICIYVYIYIYITRNCCPKNVISCWRAVGGICCPMLRLRSRPILTWVVTSTGITTSGNSVVSYQKGMRWVRTQVGSGPGFAI